MIPSEIDVPSASRPGGRTCSGFELGLEVVLLCSRDSAELSCTCCSDVSERTGEFGTALS